jgi:chromosome segregation ATPase
MPSNPGYDAFEAISTEMRDVLGRIQDSMDAPNITLPKARSTFTYITSQLLKLDLQVHAMEKEWRSAIRRRDLDDETTRKNLNNRDIQLSQKDFEIQGMEASIRDMTARNEGNKAAIAAMERAIEALTATIKGKDQLIQDQAAIIEEQEAAIQK